MSVVDDAIAFWQAQGLTVFDGEPPSAPTAPYLCVYSDDGEYDADSLGVKPTSARWALRTLSVGVDGRQTRWVRDRARRIVGEVIGGCVVAHDFANPIAADNALPTPLSYGYDQFSVTTSL